MKEGIKQGLKYLPAGVVGALAPIYGLSLLGTDFDFKEALYVDGFVTAGRGALALLGALPGINKIPGIREAYKLFLPEFYGFVGGTISAMMVDHEIKDIKERKLQKKSLEDVVVNSENH